MRGWKTWTLLVVLVSGTSVAGARAEAPVTVDTQAVRAIVREYLLEHPEVIEQAIMALNAQRREEERAQARAAITAHRADLMAHAMSPVSGDPNGDVTLVEFFDYQCGYCKRAMPPVLELLASDPRLRIVWKEFPILGPVSRFAARASLAAEKQGRYLAFHEAVMGHADPLTEDRVLRLAGGAGLDVDRLRRDMADPALEAYVNETHRLARQLGITGTPAFVVGGTLVRGVADGPQLKALIAEARRGD